MKSWPGSRLSRGDEGSEKLGRVEAETSRLFDRELFFHYNNGFCAAGQASALWRQALTVRTATPKVLRRTSSAIARLLAASIPFQTHSLRLCSRRSERTSQLSGSFRNPRRSASLRIHSTSSSSRFGIHLMVR